jgi:hypothetical protein
MTKKWSKIVQDSKQMFVQIKFIPRNFQYIGLIHIETVTCNFTWYEIFHAFSTCVKVTLMSKKLSYFYFQYAHCIQPLRCWRLVELLKVRKKNNSKFDPNFILKKLLLGYISRRDGICVYKVLHLLDHAFR